MPSARGPDRDIDDPVGPGEARLRRLLRHAPVGIVTLDGGAAITDTNPAFRELIGASEAELPGRGFADCLHEDDRARIAGKLVRIAHSGLERLTVEGRLLHRVGEPRHVRISVTCVPGENGATLELLVVVEDIDARRRAEEALQRSQQMLEIAGQMAGFGGWIWQRPNRHITWSAQSARLYGAPEGTHPTLDRIVEYCRPESRAALTQAFLACIQTGRAFDVEHEILCEDGRRAWIRSTGEAVRDVAGSVVRIQGACQDITARRDAERALRESEARFRAVAQATTDAIWEYDAGRRIVTWNEGIETMLRYPRDRIDKLPQTWIARIHPDDRGRVLAGFRQALAQRQTTLRSAFRFLRGDDTVAEIEDRVVIVYDASGRAIRLVGGMSDVTDGRRNREQIAQQSALLDAARDAIVVRDFRRGVVFWSRGAERIYGWKAEQMLGEPMLPMIYQDLSEYATVCQRVLEDGQWDGELRQKRSDGTPIAVESRWSLVRDADGTPSAIIAISTDVSARKALEEQLRQSQRLESIGQLSGGIAHDFNNLLTVILGNTELLAEATAAAEANAATEALAPLQSAIDMILSAAQHGADLTRQLLAFSRRQALQPQPVSVAATLRSMDALLRRSLTSAIELEIVAPDSLPDAYVDRTQLESTILNLCLNARDAMPAGGQLRITVSPVPPGHTGAHPGAGLRPGDYLLLSVTDTGTGIAPEHLPKVFDPFFTTKDVGKGTGLGLSIVYGFAHQSGGHVDVDSTPGAGTRFRLWLPQALAPRRDGPEASVEDETPVGGNETLLLVEDDPMVRAYATRLLHELGYTILEAAGPKQALALLERGEPADLLFTDIVMPGGMDGRQLGEAALALRPGLALLYTSGYSKYTGAETHAPGMPMLILDKPYGRRELAQMIRLALRAASPTA